jgi:hypothetical protein
MRDEERIPRYYYFRHPDSKRGHVQVDVLHLRCSELVTWENPHRSTYALECEEAFRRWV